MGTNTTAVLWMVALLLLAVVAGIDLYRRIIPNRATLVIAASGIGLGLLSRPASIGFSLGAGLLLMIGCLALAHYNLLGGGDAKLIAAVSLLIPPTGIGILLLHIGLAGGVLSGIYFVARAWLLRTSPAKRSIPRRGRVRTTSAFERFRRKERVRILSGASLPYGIAILAGVVLFVTSEMSLCSSAIFCLG